MITTLDPAVIEATVKDVLGEICAELQIDTVIRQDWRPGEFIKSHVLLSAIDMIEDALQIRIPEDCYIFSSARNTQLTISETVQKILLKGELVK